MPPPFLPHIPDFHHADSVSIAFHRRRGRGETSAHASNLIRLGEIYIRVPAVFPCSKSSPSSSTRLSSSSSSTSPCPERPGASFHPQSAPIHRALLRPRSGALLEFISGPADSKRNAQIAGYSARVAHPIFPGYPYLSVSPDAPRRPASSERDSARCALLVNFWGGTRPSGNHRFVCRRFYDRRQPARVSVPKIAKESLARVSRG